MGGVDAARSKKKAESRSGRKEGYVNVMRDTPAHTGGKEFASLWEGGGKKRSGSFLSRKRVNRCSPGRGGRIKGRTLRRD